MNCERKVEQPTPFQQYAEILWQTLGKLAKGEKIPVEQLSQPLETYPSSFYLNDLERWQKNPNQSPTKTPEDLIGMLSYATTRLFSPEDLWLIGTQPTQFHLTDDEKSFYEFSSQHGLEIQRAAKRGRLYLKWEENGEIHFAFLVNPGQIHARTNSFEVLSLIGFIDMIRRSLTQKQAYHQLNQLFKKMGLFPSEDEIKTWLQTQPTSLTLHPDLPLRNPLTYPFEKPSPLSPINRVTKKIAQKLEKLNLEANAISLGNHFSYPLLIATGLFTPEEFQKLETKFKQQHGLEDVFSIFTSIKPDKLTKEQQELVKRYLLLQWLNRYDGLEIKFTSLKTKLEKFTSTFRTRILTARETSLGDPVDFLDFTQIDSNVIDNIPETTTRQIIATAKEKSLHLLNLAYPLGDSSLSLIYFLNQHLGLNNFAFFGKVGTINGGTTIGRLVIPEYSQEANDTGSLPITEWEQASRETSIIPAADSSEIIYTIPAAVLLETIADLHQLIEQWRQENPDQTSPNILLDMEAYYLQRLLELIKELNLYTIYYVSDITRALPEKSTSTQTLVQSMGPEGAFPVMVAAISSLNQLTQKI